MGDSSVAGALVPSVPKPEAAPSADASTAAAAATAALALAEEAGTRAAVSPAADGEGPADRDLLCPICMAVIKDAFLTGCGHSFCYMCIVTHLSHKSDCPCCGHYLTKGQLYPNFLLDKVLKKISARQLAKTASPIDQFRYALEQGNNMGVKELDSLMTLIAERKRQMEQQESETNMQILLVFLHCLRKQNLEELNEIQTDLQYIKEDISAVERHRLELYRTKESASCPGSLQNKKLDLKAHVSHQGFQRTDALICSDPPSSHIQSGNVIARKRRVQAQFNELQEYYLQRRRTGAQSHRQEERDTITINREGYHAGLDDFQSVLTTFTRYSRLHEIAELRHGDLFHSANIVSSIEFDRDDELFATAGVSKRIKVFEFSSVVNKPSDMHCPVVEMATRSKLSCLSWNKYSKNVIASSDYEGIVTVWDVQTRQSVMEYEEHEKRAWSVDFSRTEPSMLVSGSDDCKVKVWCTKQEASVINIDMKANICSVKYNPGSSRYVAVGSADHNIHYFDLRNPSAPVHIFGGHKKTVSYVKFLSNNELASASTDSTLRLWDVKDNCPVRTFRGHKNEKNFVGLSVNNEYIACGSETNQVFAYHKAISKPAANHRFLSSVLDDTDDDPGSYFISAVCWKSDSPTMLAANSQGTIKVLVLAP
ncbi:E3 ubiquitin-protein ligase COP1-like isoform X2 [Phragmites australis]|uniref:E3 ubiquitin-protein ligase COP1-like isoform X2 n=1 Tax=Phragmites australis TaxID=29695 RepID=UPI002D771C3D|nr:E3 ubiquitin-protein ligase COP1-like isoform X2 [Phragmites australis]